ncbi:MAG: glycosyltransferase family 4 protein [Cyclobacteriaceae bacterium]|nr:glycosyltransferase family 4 protein [Cyclobacteriaceae bacterium]
MRIAMFLDTDFPPDSRVENEAVSLIKKGHEVFLFSLSYKPFKNKDEVVNGIHVFRYSGSKLLYKLSALVYTFPFFSNLVKPKLKDFISLVKPDTLHVHDMPLAESVMHLNKQFGLPLTLDLHEDRPEIMKFYPHLNKLPGKLLISPKKWAKKQVELMKKADKVILVTKEAKGKFSTTYPQLMKKITVVPNTINPQIFLQYSIDNELVDRYTKHSVILYLGDTGLRRGTDTAIKAMPYVLKEVPDAKLVLVGKNSEDSILKKIVQELNLEDNVFFEGWQDVSLFPSYIKASSVCISPIKRNPHHDTTYANKIFQYMAMGKPQVVSDCPAQQHVIEAEHCGLVHIAEDEKDLANKLIEVLSNPDLANRMGENAKGASQERWNWDVTSIELINHYDSFAQFKS